MSQISFRTLRQRTRQRNSAAISSPHTQSTGRSTFHPSEEWSAMKQQPPSHVQHNMYGSAVSPHSSSGECAGGVEEEVLEVELPHVEWEAQEEEEGVQFEDAGHVPEESVEQRKRAPMGREAIWECTARRLSAYKGTGALRPYLLGVLL